MPDSYGPAGIFSTDDAAADQRQIEAEQGPREDESIQPDPFHDEDEYLYEDLEEDEQPEPILVQATAGSPDCPNWYAMELIEPHLFQVWIESVTAQHQTACGCNAKMS